MDYLGRFRVTFVYLLEVRFVLGLIRVLHHDYEEQTSQPSELLQSLSPLHVFKYL